MNKVLCLTTDYYYIRAARVPLASRPECDNQIFIWSDFCSSIYRWKLSIARAIRAPTHVHRALCIVPYDGYVRSTQANRDLHENRFVQWLARSLAPKRAITNRRRFFPINAKIHYIPQLFACAWQRSPWIMNHDRTVPPPPHARTHSLTQQNVRWHLRGNVIIIISTEHTKNRLTDTQGQRQDFYCICD